MSRTARLAVALAAALAAPAVGAQWRAEPMVVWLDRPGLDVVAAPFAPGAPAEDDLLVVDQARRLSQERPHHGPLAPQPSSFPVASMPLERAFRAGRLAPGGPDAIADVASHYATAGIPTGPSQVEVVFGSEPATVRGFGLPFQTSFHGPSEGGPPYVVSFLRLLARPQRPDTLVMPYCLEDVCARLFVVDPATVSTADVRTLPAPDLEPMDVQPEAFPAWISTTARAHALDDVAAGSFGTVVLWAHRSAVTAGPTLAALDLADPVVLGTTRHVGPPPPWLPPTVPRFDEVRGVATLDVDLDGLPDLVFTMGNPDFPLAGSSLVWVRNTGAVADFANPVLATWQDLGALLGLADPVTVRPLRGDPPSIAVWDRAEGLVVVTPVPAEGRLAVWRAPAPGALARDIRLADVVGSPAPDLVVWMENGAQPTAVLVYPDLGAPLPGIAWAPGSPGSPARGVPHPMAVVPDPVGATTLAVDWISGAVTTAPVGTGLSHVFPPDCTMPPPSLDVTVRATDPTGVFTELRSGPLPVGALQLALALAGAPAPGRLVLPPGGTTAVLDGTAATGCGAASFGGTPWPAAATVTDTSAPTSLRRTVVLPEAAYPALLAEPAFVASLATADPGASPAAISLPLSFDASGLVEVRQEADRTSLAAGELAVLRTRLRSRVGVALPAIRVVDVLSGLAAAGPPVVTGAAVVATAAGGTELVLDALPPAAAEVTIDLPVRAVGGARGSGVEARSSGGWPLTPPVRVAPPDAPEVPGCGCGAGSGPGSLALVLAAAALRRRRRAGAAT